MDKSKFNMYGLLAIMVTVFTFLILGYIVISGKGGDNALFAIVAAINGFVNLALGFFFGSNKQAADVTKQKIATEAKKEEPC